MHVVQSSEADRILSVGVWLGPEHRNWALNKEQALTAIDCLREAGITVLGGDVLGGPEENYRHTYDNWYFEPQSSGAESDAVSSGAQKASSYVRGYPRADAYFVLVTIGVND